MDMLSGLQIEADIINLTILECKFMYRNELYNKYKDNKSNHIGM